MRNSVPIPTVWGQGFGPAAELPLGAKRYVSLLKQTNNQHA